MRKLLYLAILLLLNIALHGQTITGTGVSFYTSGATSKTGTKTVATGSLVVWFAGTNTATPATTTSLPTQCASATAITAFGATASGTPNGISGWYCVTTSSGTLSVTVSSCGSDCGLDIAEFVSSTGWPAQASVKDGGPVNTTGSGATTTPTTASITVSGTNELIVSYYLNEAGVATLTAGSGFTSAATAIGHSDMLEYKTSVSTSQTASYTTTSSGGYIIQSLSFKPNAGGGATCSLSIALMGVGCR